MADKNEQIQDEAQAGRSIHDLKPGSSKADAARVSGDGDFGVRPDDATEASYTSTNTRRSDPGAAHARSSDDMTTRASGAGAEDSGPGSASGGDIDNDFVGVGRKHDSSDDVPPGPVGGDHNVEGSMVLPPDRRTVGGTGADDATPSPPAGPDGAKDINNAFVGEVSTSEASGRDDAGK